MLQLATKNASAADRPLKYRLVDDEAHQRCWPPGEDRLPRQASRHSLLDDLILQGRTHRREHSLRVLFGLQQPIHYLGIVGKHTQRLRFQPGRIPEERRVLCPRHLILHLLEDPARVEQFVHHVDEPRWRNPPPLLVGSNSGRRIPCPRTTSGRSSPARNRNRFICRPNTRKTPVPGPEEAAPDSPCSAVVSPGSRASSLIVRSPPPSTSRSARMLPTASPSPPGSGPTRSRAGGCCWSTSSRAAGASCPRDAGPGKVVRAEVDCPSVRRQG